MGYNARIQALERALKLPVENGKFDYRLDTMERLAYSTGFLNETETCFDGQFTARINMLNRVVDKARAHKTLSGDVLEFNTIVDEELTKAVVTLSPTQNLNGYSKPWAGGSEKNKFSTVFTANKIVRNDGVVDNEWRSATIEYIAVEPSTTYVLSYTESQYQYAYALYDANKDYTYFSDWVDCGGTFTTGANDKFVRFNYKSNVPPTNVQLEVGSTATAYIPYENACPITGTSSVSLWVSDTHDETIPATKTASLGTTVYGGTYDFVSGKLKTTMKNIASYSGETISEPWLSSLDEYSSGSTPTTGAQVVCPKTASTSSKTPQSVSTLYGKNYVWASSKPIEIAY